MSSDDTSTEFNEIPPIEWRPISFTLVLYPKGDLFGKLLAWSSLSPQGIGAGFIALILFRRDLHTITFFLGTLVNECINLVLKSWFKQPRPILRDNMYSGYGMPSSHAQFMCFFSTYIVLFVMIRLHHMNNNSPVEKAMRLIVVILCWIATIIVCFSRIYLQYHSWAQVIVGSVVGSLFGILWFCFTQWLSPYFPYVVSWKISEFLLLRDTTLIPNILWFEYTATRQESRARARKLISMKSQ